MIRRYCDLCSAEMTDKNTPAFGTNGSRLAVKLPQRNGVELGVEVIQMVNGTSNTGDVCTHCVLDALYAIDDRPVVRRASTTSAR